MNGVFLQPGLTSRKINFAANRHSRDPEGDSRRLKDLVDEERGERPGVKPTAAVSPPPPVTVTPADAKAGKGEPAKPAPVVPAPTTPAMVVTPTDAKTEKTGAAIPAPVSPPGKVPLTANAAVVVESAPVAAAPAATAPPLAPKEQLPPPPPENTAKPGVVMSSTHPLDHPGKVRDLSSPPPKKAVVAVDDAPTGPPTVAIVADTPTPSAATEAAITPTPPVAVTEQPPVTPLPSQPVSPPAQPDDSGETLPWLLKKLRIPIVLLAGSVVQQQTGWLDPAFDKASTAYRTAHGLVDDAQAATKTHSWDTAGSLVSASDNGQKKITKWVADNWKGFQGYVFESRDANNAVNAERGSVESKMKMFLEQRQAVAETSKNLTTADETFDPTKQYGHKLKFMEELGKLATQYAIVSGMDEASATQFGKDILHAIKTDAGDEGVRLAPIYNQTQPILTERSPAKLHELMGNLTQMANQSAKPNVPYDTKAMQVGYNKSYNLMLGTITGHLILLGTGGLAAGNLLSRRVRRRTKTVLGYTPGFVKAPVMWTVRLPLYFIHGYRHYNDPRLKLPAPQTAPSPPAPFHVEEPAPLPPASTASEEVKTAPAA